MVRLGIKKYRGTVLACYTGLLTQAICANYVPLLYVTFYKTYGIPLSEVAVISTLFFIVQLTTDFICAGVVDKIGYRPCLIVAEAVSGAGMAGLAFLPDILPSRFAGTAICVIAYAVGSGIIEVLASPTIGACPFENKEGAMSFFHAFYCWGSVFVILCSTLVFYIFGVNRWRALALIWSAVPFFNVLNFAVCPMAKPVEDGRGMPLRGLLKSKTFWLLCLLMVCAGASELAMEQWASAFAETALHVSKAVGDLVGPCGFLALMALCRTLYGRFGRKLNLAVCMSASGVLCLGCYLLAGFSRNAVTGFIGCAVCGFSVGVMWPGSIIAASKILPSGGTAMFALLALAGDFGGSLGPAAVGAVSQNAGNNLKIGLLSCIVFPALLTVCALVLLKRRGAKSVL